MDSSSGFSTGTVGLCDLETVWSLERNIFGETDRFTKRQLRYLLTSPNTTFRLCYAEGACIGYGISLINRLRNGKLKGRIYSIGLLPGYRHQGAGCLLLKAMESDLYRAKVFFITLETKKGGMGADGFFAEHGYHKVQELPNYYASAHGVRMRKELPRKK